jgi:hypothetical protein
MAYNMVMAYPAKTITGFDYFSGKTETYNVDANDLVINAYQPKAVLLNVLMEPTTFIADSATYDITAWALPYALRPARLWFKRIFKPATASWNVAKPAALQNTHAYAYVSSWQSIADVRFLAAIMKKGIKARYSERRLRLQVRNSRQALCW